MSGLSHHISNIIEDAVPRSAERSPHQGNTCVKIHVGKTRFLRRTEKEFFNVRPVLRHYSECFTTKNVPKLIPDVRTADNRNIPVSSNFLTFDDRQLPSCWQSYKITYLYVFSFRMFHSELLWRLFTLTSMTISVSSDGSTVWRHDTEWRGVVIFAPSQLWRHGFRAVFIMYEGHPKNNESCRISREPWYVAYWNFTCLWYRYIYTFDTKMNAIAWRHTVWRHSDWRHIIDWVRGDTP